MAVLKSKKDRIERNQPEMEFYRDTWAQVNLDAIQHNIEQLQRHLPDQTQIMAVVKANGYGHGALETAETAMESGASWLGVAILDEALALRNQGISAPILVLGYTRPKDLTIASEHGISLTVYQTSWLEEAKTHYKRKGPAFFHIKVDTGMGRIGVRDEAELTALISTFKSDPRFVIEGLFTHYATADDPESDYYNEQTERFASTVAFLKEMGVNPNLIHSANSAAALRNESNLFNMVRFGISMYGLTPSQGLKPQLPFRLEEAFNLHSRLIHVKLIEAGETVGYGQTFKADRKMWVGTVPIGYADGWLRKLTGSDLVIKGVRCKVIGRICMDQLMCALPEPFEVGEKVTLIGEGLTIDEVAEWLGTINYEVPCMINERVPRIYLKDGHPIKVKNPINSGE